MLQAGNARLNEQMDFYVRALTMAEGNVRTYNLLQEMTNDNVELFKKDNPEYKKISLKKNEIIKVFI